MTAQSILASFLTVRLIQFLAEKYLARINRNYYSNMDNQKEAEKVLSIPKEDMDKALNYSTDKFNFSRISSTVSLFFFLLFLVLGGLGTLESFSKNISQSMGTGTIVTGLVFFALLGVLSFILSTPFEYYFNFTIEEKHGFNKQTKKLFFMDKIKGLLVSVILGGPILALILYLMESSGTYWWVYTWFAVFGFSLLTAWIYPQFLAPLFNKFHKIDEGELKEKIYTLAEKIEFNAGEISIMDASKRSSHGNAYFTGVFGKKKIVLFDTLIKSMNPSEIIAVLAHELGHFKLNHIRWSLVRAFFITGLTFYLLSICLPIEEFYTAFYFGGKSSYGALMVFSILFGPIGFLFQPISNFLSQKNEFEADDFALSNIENKKELGNALLKLRENSQVMPISHPLFAKVYLSHPPLMERLKAMKFY